MFASQNFPSFGPPAQLLWGAEVPSHNVHEERQILRSLLVSDYGQFKAIVFGDPLKTLPQNKSLDEVIEDYLRAKYGDRYAVEVAD